MDKARARRLILNYTGARDETVVAAAAERMVKNDECAWHALAQVTGKECWCGDCMPGPMPRLVSAQTIKQCAEGMRIAADSMVEDAELMLRDYAANRAAAAARYEYPATEKKD